MDIRVLKHASIKIDNIYIDPYQIDRATHDASIIFITHDHYDHFSIDDIKKLWNKKTIIVAPTKIIDKIIKELPTRYININQYSLYYIGDDLVFSTFPAYNINKNYHKKTDGGVGYVITYQHKVFVDVGDSDMTPEILKFKCDYLFVPIGGTYTMDAKEAANYTNIIRPKVVFPMHYNLIIGDRRDERIFRKNILQTIKCIPIQ